MLTRYLQDTLAPAAAVRLPRSPGRRRRPHPPETLARVEALVTQTNLSCREIAARTGLSAATVSRRARRHGWYRPDSGHPDDLDGPEARRRTRRGRIAEALVAEAERLLLDTEMNPAARPIRIRRIAELVRLSRTIDEEENGLKPKGRRPKRAKRAIDKLPPRRDDPFAVDIANMPAWGKNDPVPKARTRRGL
jgi:transposase-like protein